MNTPKRSAGRRLVAALGAAALSLVGIAGVASADPSTPTLGPGNIDPNATGQITIHKFEEAGSLDKLSPDGSDTPSGLTPLDGVVFTATAVPSIDLTTNAGWAAIDSLTAQDATGTVRTFPVTGSAGSAGQATLSGLPVGVYYIQETAVGNNNISDKAAPFFVTVPLPNGTGTSSQWLYNIHVYPKNTVTGASKTVAAPDGLGLGANVTWTIAVDIPTLAAAATFSKFSVVDTLPDGVEYVGSSVTAPASAPAGVLTQSGQTVTFGNTGSVSAELNSWLKSNGGSKLTFTVTGKITNVGALQNSATVTVNNWTGTPTATTRWGAIDITKTDTAGKALSGAEFQVFRSETEATSGTSPIAVNGVSTFPTGVDGKVSIPGLFVSSDPETNTSRDYWVKETKAPAGYRVGDSNGPAGIWKVSVTSDQTASVALSVTNEKVPPVELPLTGANGQLLALIGGGSLVLLAAGTALVARKRSHQD